MNRRWMLLLITGMAVMQLTGCGNAESKESTDIVKESAVESSTADSDNVKSERNEEAQVSEKTEYVTEPAELVCVLPKGFLAADGEEGLYVHKSYPTDLSTISYVISEGDEDLTEMDMKEYEAEIEDSYYETYGDEVDIVISSYEDIIVDGRKALKIKITYEFKGISYDQLIYMIYNGNETHIMNYTQESGGKWMEKFEESGASIWFKSME